jgi:hypothetical protein
MNFFEAFRLVYGRQPTLTESGQFVNDPVGQQNVINQATRMQEQTTQVQPEPVQVAEEPVQVAEEPVQVAEDTSGMFTGTQNDINTGFIDTSAGFAEQTSVDLDKRKANIEQELRKQYETVQLSGYSYPNPEDLDNIFSRQAEAIAIAGVDSLLDIGQRTEKVRDNVKEVQQITDPETGEVTYQYTPSSVSNIAGITEPEPITVENEYVKPMVSNDGLYGSQVTKYVATLPDEAPVLYNKKTGERLNMFNTKGELYRDYGNGATFGELYGDIEGGAYLQAKFFDDDTALFFPQFKDTSDKKFVSLAITGASLALGMPNNGLPIGSGGTSYASTFGSTVSGLAADSIAAFAIGNAALAGTTTYALTGDAEKAFMGALVAAGTTYGVDYIRSGEFGDFLVDNNILGENTTDYVDSLGIPTTDSYSLLERYNIDPITGEVTGTTTVQPSLADPSSSFVGSEVVTDPITGGLTTIPDDSILGTFDPSANPLVDQGFVDNVTFDGLLSGTQGIDDLPFLTAADVGTDAVTGGLTITNAAGATEAVTKVIENLGAGAVTAKAAEKVIEEAGKFIDLKEVFGDDIGGLLENVANVGIDYRALELLQDKAEKAGEDIQADYNKVFKPFTVRTGLGVTDIDPVTGEAKSVRDIAYEPIQTSALGTAESMFKDLPTTRDEATAKSLAATRALTDPQRQRDQEKLFNRLQQQGTMGLGITTPTVGGQRRINPLAESLFAAQEQAKSYEALAAQQMGLGQAASQRQLATGLLSTAQDIDERAKEFSTLQSLSNLRATPELEGLQARREYDLLALQAEIDRIRGVASGTKGLFGLPTEQGNTYNIMKS